MDAGNKDTCSVTNFYQCDLASAFRNQSLRIVLKVNRSPQGSLSRADVDIAPNNYLSFISSLSPYARVIYSVVLLLPPKSDWPASVRESLRLREDLAFLQDINTILISKLKGIAPNCWHKITPSCRATLFDLVC
jgi:hypothetical protein